MVQACQEVYNLIRGCNPAPGAWTLHGDVELQIFDCRLGDAVGGEPGMIAGVDDNGMVVAANGGSIHVHRVESQGRQEGDVDRSMRARAASRSATGWSEAALPVQDETQIDK